MIVLFIRSIAVTEISSIREIIRTMIGEQDGGTIP